MVYGMHIYVHMCICTYINVAYSNLTQLYSYWWMCVCIYNSSNWESLEAYWEQPQLVHDIIDDSDHEYFDDEDDENG